MVRVASCFSQVLSLIDRKTFDRHVRELKAERCAKGFDSWTHFVSMVFCQMAAADSLREICGGLATALGKLVHLGVAQAPKRSTLAYANAHRPWKLYEQTFYALLARCQALAATKHRKFRFKNPLLLLDATTINLCLEAFDWAKFRRAKGAVKLHLQLAHQGCLPCWALVTDGKTHEVKIAQNLAFPPGTIVAMDKGYTDYRLFGSWTENKVFFVTRIKNSCRYEVVGRNSVPEEGTIRRDDIIQFSGPKAGYTCPYDLRLIVVYDADNDRLIEILTNIHNLSAKTVAAIYKERWQIELFFKALKQNLKIKTFVGTSENAVQSQIWTALIAILLLKFLQLNSSWKWSLSNLAAMLRFNLLTYRDLWDWLNAPFDVPITEPLPVQMTLKL